MNDSDVTDKMWREHLEAYGSARKPEARIKKLVYGVASLLLGVVMGTLVVSGVRIVNYITEPWPQPLDKPGEIRVGETDRYEFDYQALCLREGEVYEFVAEGNVVIRNLGNGALTIGVENKEDAK